MSERWLLALRDPLTVANEVTNVITHTRDNLPILRGTVDVLESDRRRAFLSGLPRLLIERSERCVAGALGLVMLVPPVVGGYPDGVRATRERFAELGAAAGRFVIVRAVEGFRRVLVL